VAQVVDVSCSDAGDVWAITRGGQLLVRVQRREGDASEVPVVRHSCYENQRWWFGLLPMVAKGWSDLLLPTDRSAWSNAAGDHRVTRDSFQVSFPNQQGWGGVIWP